MKSRHSELVSPDYSRVLTAVFEFMLVSGLSADAVLVMAKDAVRAAAEKSDSFYRDSPGTLATTALVLDAWHRDRRYLNSKAHPRAVRLLGRAPSVEALVHAEDGGRAAAGFARQLKELGFVIACGKGLYRPTGNIALLSALDPMALQHVAHSLTTLLETIARNLSRRQKSERLVERFAEVPDLPATDESAFQRFAQIQSWILLQTTNDWLESRRAKRAPRATKDVIRAGIHVHAYVSQPKKEMHSRKNDRASAL